MKSLSFLKEQCAYNLLLYVPFIYPNLYLICTIIIHIIIIFHHINVDMLPCKILSK